MWQHAGPQYQPQKIPFTGNPGFQVDTQGFRLIDYYELFLDDDLVNHITAQTNIFAEQYIRGYPNLPPHSDICQWTHTNPRKMRQFLGIVLLMGILKETNTDMYWFTDVLYATPVFAKIMTRLRRRLLVRFVHYNDNANEPDRNDPQRDQLYKI